MNELSEFKILVPQSKPPEELRHALNLWDDFLLNVYSYFVALKNDDVLVKVHVSAESTYNTIPWEQQKDLITANVTDYLASDQRGKCIAFGQPPLELLCKLYQPLILSLAARFHKQWSMVDVDDIVGMGNYLLCKLYNNGYYINRYLLGTALNNEVLKEVKTKRIQQNCVSFEDMFYREESRQLAYGERLVDSSDEERVERDLCHDIEQYTFNQVRDYCIERIGQERWDELWHEYSQHCTTGKTRSTMAHLKKEFAEKHLTRQKYIMDYWR